jgi:hypothetical protein
MPRLRSLHLSARQRAELVAVRDRHPKPYLRERAAALLRIADGEVLRHVARRGLLRPRTEEAVSGWLDRYLADGVAGLAVRPGRGRKPAFSPLRAVRRPGRRRPG